MTLRRAKSAEEYIEWVKQAVFEVQDLRECLEYELEDMGKVPAFLDPLQESINAVYQAMVTGTYHFGREDLPFVGILSRYADEVPFHTLLKQINETHRHGLAVEAGD